VRLQELRVSLSLDSVGVDEQDAHGGSALQELLGRLGSAELRDQMKPRHDARDLLSDDH
jgi:hypothetical protein